MGYLQECKDTLINNLWFPVVKSAADYLQPRLQKNKKLEILTLTSAANCHEIERFVNTELSTHKNITAWGGGHLDMWGLPAEGNITLHGGKSFRDTFYSGDFSDLGSKVCYHVLNFDFASQRPNKANHPEYICRELVSIERFIGKLSKCANLRGFVIIYTTALPSDSVDFAALKDESDRIHKSGWAGIAIPSSEGDFGSSIEEILEELTRKYDMSIDSSSKSSMTLKQENQIHSIAYLTRK